MWRIPLAFCLIGSVCAYSQLVFSIYENDDFTSLGLLPNSTGVQRKLNKSQRVQIWYFCKLKSDTDRCGYWSDENGRKIDGDKSVTVERDNDTARLRNFHFGEDGEYIKYPTNEETAYEETYFLFVIPKPPTTRKTSIC